MAHKLMPEIIKRQAARKKTMLPGQAAELERIIAKYDAHPELLIPKEKVLAKLRNRR